VAIFAHAHLGLSSYIGIDGDGTFAFPETSSVALPAQIQAHVEFLDEILAAYDPTTRVLLVGHSIGAWFIQKVLKARASSLRPRVGAYMLFPTLSHIGETPSGRMLSVRASVFAMCPRFDFDPGLLMPPFLPFPWWWCCLSSRSLALPLHDSTPPPGCRHKPLFRPPWPRTLAYLSLLVRHVPPFVLRLAQPSWPASQLEVLRNFLRSPRAIFASLTMAHDEMETVRELDADFLREFAENLRFYYAEEDHWVGEQRAGVLRALSRGTAAAESHVVLGRGGVPHAFCISFVSPPHPSFFSW
jgi:pimeloyl-ACP methyl ester carboxylesterase